MLFAHLHSNETALNAWHAGKYLPAPIHAINHGHMFLLSRLTGSLGWNSVTERMREENKTPIKPNTKYNYLFDRISQSWNVYLGVNPIHFSVLSNLLDTMAFLHVLEENKNPIFIGGSEAKLLLEEFRNLRAISDARMACALIKQVTDAQNRTLPVLEVISIANQVESKGSDFNFGLFTQFDDSPITDQTFKIADANRLVLCYNALRECPDEILSSTLIPRIINLAIRMHLAIKKLGKLPKGSSFINKSIKLIDKMGGDFCSQQVSDGFLTVVD